MVGLLGIAAFFFLRSDIDYQANSPINESATEIEDKVRRVAEGLGFSTDSLAIASVYQQYTSYLNTLRDSLPGNVTPGYMNERSAHIQSWTTVIGRPEGASEAFISGQTLFSEAGYLKVQTANNGKVIRLQNNEDLPNPTFVQGDSIEAAASKVVGDILGYNLEDYFLAEDEYTDSLEIYDEGQAVSSRLLNGDLEATSDIEIIWRRKSSANEGPQLLTVSLEPVILEFENASGFSTRFGYRVNSFIAKNEFEPEILAPGNGGQVSLFDFFLFGSVLILTILVFVVGIRNIFKGKVEWRRALFVFLSISMVLFGWRSIYFWNTFNPFFDSTGMFVAVLNSLLFGLVAGVYGAMSYISWEAFARTHKMGQVELVDAFWQRKFFVREIGASLISGLSVGGILLGGFAIAVFLSDTYFFQADSQFGFAEASITPKILTINMTAWSTSWLVGFAQIGFVYGFCQQWIKNHWVMTLAAIISITVFLASLGRVVGTPMDMGGDLLIFLGLGLVVVYAYKTFGIVTTNTAWWVFLCVLMVSPYIGSESTELASAWWAQIFIISTVFIYGLISYRFGVPVSEVGDYIPEYQERIAQHLRVEKEIEIARESQYKLMPLQPPVADGIDVYGFFLPSFEVGGDYFDYVLSKDKDGNPEALTMTVVDVSGKAMMAAMPAIFTSGLLLSRMKEDAPEKILSDVSEPIYTRTDKRTFITCAIARYNLESGMMSVANAGHCKPILKRNGAADFIQTPDPKYPLGLYPDTRYTAHEFRLKKRDVFLMYSDGLPEAINDKGERFGFDEVPRLLEQIDTENLTANEIAQEIKRTVQKFSNYQLADDTTVICLKV